LDCAYLIFGLRVRSNLSLPGLDGATAGFDDPDVSIYLGTCPPIQQPTSPHSEELVYTSPHKLESGEPALHIWKNEGAAQLRMEYFDGTRFWLSAHGDKVWAQWPEELTLADTATYLLGPVFGYMLRLRGITCLHASAVEIDGRAVAFVGPPGAGKSTVAAALALRGHAALADDIVAIVERDGVFRAMPAYPYLSLWQDSALALYGDDGRLEPFSQNFSKRMLPLAAAAGELQFAPKPALLDSILLLGERSADPAAPFVEDVEKRDALMSLVGNTYANTLLEGDQRAREFAFLARLIAGVRVRRLRSHDKVSRLGALCELIEREMAQDSKTHSLIAAIPTSGA